MALELTAHQREAFLAATAFLGKPKRFQAFVLTGSAGTGKTTLLNALADYLEAVKQSYALMAPTGRASRVLAARTGRPTRTVHSHLYVPEPLSDRPGVRLVRKPYDFEPPSVLIIDEASLIASQTGGSDSFEVGTPLLADLVHEAERTRAQLIFVGDPCQLPPVGETTSVALDVEQLQRTYRLSCQAAHLWEVLRQQEGSVVLDAATSLRDQLEGKETPFPKVPTVSLSRAIEGYQRLLDKGDYREAVFLAYRNADVHLMNQRVRAALGFTGVLAAGDLVVTERDGWSAGELVPRSEPYLVKEVLPSESFADCSFAFVKLQPLDGGSEISGLALLDTLTNDRGQIPYERERELFASAATRNDEFRLTRKPADDPHVGALRLRYGYALTVHKAQGGEWPVVFMDDYVPKVVDPESGVRWRYTAATRARTHLVRIRLRG